MPRLEELRVAAGTDTLVGTLTLPDAPAPADRGGRYPNVLLLPSWLPRGRDGGYDRARHATWFAPEPSARPGLLARLADALAEHGVASLRCDPRGSGSSDGAWESTDLFTRIDDARDQLASMRRQPNLDLRRAGIIGHGEGAAIALAVAIADPAISALTLIGPASRSWRATLRRGVASRARHDAERRHPIVASLDRWAEELIEGAERRESTFRLTMANGETIDLALAGVEQAIHMPPMALATMLDRSVSIVHGALDRWSDPEESALLQRALPPGAATASRTVVSDAGHDLDEAGDEVIGRIAADLAARLLPRDLPPVLLAIEAMG
jgi:alpha-beta hydrolase superfamily lysophospholipase